MYIYRRKQNNHVDIDPGESEGLSWSFQTDEREYSVYFESPIPTFCISRSAKIFRFGFFYLIWNKVMKVIKTRNPYTELQEPVHFGRTTNSTINYRIWP